MRTTLCLAIFTTLLACQGKKPQMVIPYLKAWDEKTITLCCERETADRDCEARHWTQVIQQHCKGRASKTSGSETSNCLTYRCDGKVQPYLFEKCSPGVGREISIEFIVDPSFKTFGDWKERIDQAVKHATELYEPVGIHFKLAQILEKPLRNGGDRPQAYFAELRGYETAEADIHVGLASAVLPGENSFHSLLGQSSFFGNRLVIGTKDFLSLKYVLAHEIGHNFGAVHVDDYRSIMSPTLQGIPAFASMDRMTEQTIRLTKCMDFRRGAESLSETTIRQLSDLYDSEKVSVLDNPLAHALSGIGDDALDRGAASLAASLYRRAQMASRDHAYWKLKIAVANLYEKKYEEASNALFLLLNAQKDLDLSICTRDFGVHHHVSLETRAKYFLASALRQGGRLDQARPILEGLMKFDRKFLWPFLEMGYLAFDQKQYAVAAAYLHDFLKIVPNHSEAKALLAKAESRPAS